MSGNEILGERSHKSRFDPNLAEEVNKDYAIQTTEDELVAKYYSVVELDENLTAIDPLKACFEWVTATEVAERMKNLTGYAMTTNSAKNFGAALTKAGFAWQKSGAKRYAVIATETVESLLAQLNKNREPEPTLVFDDQGNEDDAPF